MYCPIDQIEIYPGDSIIHLSNKGACPRLGWVIVLCFEAKNVNLTMSFSTQESKIGIDEPLRKPDEM